MVKLPKGGDLMFVGSLMGLLSLFFVVAIHVAIVFLLIWIYRIFKNSDIQVEQNKKIIDLLEKIRE